MALVDFRSLLLFSALLRIFLIVYGEWQDTHMEVRYTDVDYFVFSDAAALMASGKSPYARSTYRYSPLLALLLVPNSIIHRSWGKFLFSASDLFVGLFIHTILKLRGVPENLRLYSVAAWLLNPFTFTIGTRGNCEPIVCAMILWIIICLMNGETCHFIFVAFSFFGAHFISEFRVCVQSYRLSIDVFGELPDVYLLTIFGLGRVLQAAFFYGLVVHFRVYPIIYSLSILLVLDPHVFQTGQTPALQKWSSRQQKQDQNSRSTKTFSLTFLCFLLKSFVTKDRIIFGVISGAMFFFWTGVFYHLYGWEFLHEALLYHLTRTDPRHNFSIYFYHIYLHHQHGFSTVEKLISFLPQLLVQLVFTFCFAHDLPFCLFVQTVAFVAFNKVITAQYFVWFFCLLPLILPWTTMKMKWKGLSCTLIWVGAQVHWLMWGYLLEFKGKNVFAQLWFASLLFLAANTFVLVMVIRHHFISPVFLPLKKTNSFEKMPEKMM